jgi:hypothetical protein
LLDLHRRYAMPGDVTDVVHVPLETAEAVQHIISIYDTGTYNQRPVFPVASANSGSLLSEARQT